MSSLIILISLALFCPKMAFAYPEFIGYKYTSCVTCHYNGNGNGPLNDYGRAVWASEIAGRMLSGNKTAEQLGDESGFLGKQKMWWWLRPGIKARDLVLNTNPGKSDSDIRNILMQASVNVAILFDRKQSLILVGDFGYAPIPFKYKSQPSSKHVDEWISREHYLRWHATKSSWWYVGMMDKVYGLRISNHTAYSRSKTGLAQSDQSHGVIYQYIQPKWQISVNGFAGNLYQESDLRQHGGSTMFEYEIVPNFMLGASALVSSNDYIGLQRFAIHTRRGYGNGSSLLFELGTIGDKPKSGNSRLGYYVFSEAMQRLRRGYHLFISGQAYKEDLTGKYLDTLKVSAGFLMFPMAKTEFRLETENTRYLARDEVKPEAWAIMGQFHISL